MTFPVNSAAYWDATFEREIGEGRPRSHVGVWRLLLGHIPENGVVVDVGCGTGEFLRWVRSQRPTQPLLGLDHSPWAIGHAQEIEGREGVSLTSLLVLPRKRLRIDFLVSDALRIRVPTNTARTVYSGHLLEHLADPVAALRQQRRILRRGGTVIAHFPHDDTPYIEHLHVLTFGLVMGWMEEAGFLVEGHSEVIPGQPTNDGFVYGRK